MIRSCHTFVVIIATNARVYSFIDFLVVISQLRTSQPAVIRLVELIVYGTYEQFKGEPIT